MSEEENEEIIYKRTPRPSDKKCEVKGCDNPLFTNYRCSVHMEK